MSLDAQRVWEDARKYMPFDAAYEIPFFIPSRIPIDLEQAKHLFEAFDDNLNGLLERTEVRLLLNALGMSETAIDPALDIMFEEVDQLNFADVRLWIKRVGFIERELCWVERIYYTLDVPTHSKAAKLWAIFMVTCILLSVVMYMFESHPHFMYQSCKGCEPELKPKETFANVEFIVIVIFSIDYLIRFLTVHSTRSFAASQEVLPFFLSFEVLKAPEWYNMRALNVQKNLEISNVRKTFFWMISPMNVIDFFSIAPYFFGRFVDQTGAAMVLRVLRLCRLFRLFKLKKYSSRFDVFFQTLAQSFSAITVLLLILVLLLVLIGSLTYLVEGGTWYTPDHICSIVNATGPTCRQVYGDEFSGAYLRPDFLQQELEETPFLSIFDACWFTIATITSVGYGDLSPTTAIGQSITMFCMVLGILAMAMPITVLGSNFDSQFEGNLLKKQNRKNDVFTTLRIGLKKHMAQLDSKSAEYAAGEEELRKMTCTQELLAKQYILGGKKHYIYGHYKKAADALGGQVKEVANRLDGLQRKMDKVTEVIDDMQ
jgi:hypothetical protein